MVIRYDRLLYEFHVEGMTVFDAIYEEAFTWLKDFEANVVAAIANKSDDLPNLQTPARKKRHRKKSKDTKHLPPAKKLSMNCEPLKKVSVHLVRIHETSEARTSVVKPLTPAKPPRRNTTRLASINATKKFSQIIVDENTDPAKLRFTRDENGEPQIMSKEMSRNVQTKVMAYEAKLSSGALRHNSVNIEPVATLVDEVVSESPPAVCLPVHVSSAVLTLSHDKNRKTFSPHVTCSPLKISELADMKTNRGTYLLTAKPFFKLPSSSMGASRRRSSAMRIKLRSNLRKSKVLFKKSSSAFVRDSFIKIDEDLPSESVNVEGQVVDDSEDEVMEIDNDEEVAFDGAVEARSPNSTYNLRGSRPSGDGGNKKSPRRQGQEDFVSDTPSPLPLKLQLTEPKRKGYRSTNTVRTPILRVPRLQSSTLVKHSSTKVWAKTKLSCGSSNSSMRSQRVRSLVQTPKEKELKLVNAWKIKEQKAREILKKRDDMLHKRVQEHKRKLEERFDKASKVRKEKEKEKMNKRREQAEEEARRAEAAAQKKRELERQQRQDEVRSIQEQRRAEREREKQRLGDLQLAKKQKSQAKKEEKSRVDRENAEAKNRAEEHFRSNAAEEEKRVLEEEERSQVEEDDMATAAVCSINVSVVCEKLDETRTIAKNPAQLNTTVTLNSSTAGISSYDMTPQRDPTVQEELENPDNYNIDDIKEDDSTDDEDEPKKQIPDWADGRHLRIQAIKHIQSSLTDIKMIFPPDKMPRLDLAEIFKKKKSRFYHRTSSAVWKSPPLKDADC